MLLKGNASVSIEGRALGQDFKLKLTSLDMIGMTSLGGKVAVCSVRECQSKLNI